jgi:hypothetical protein
MEPCRSGIPGGSPWSIPWSIHRHDPYELPEEYMEYIWNIYGIYMEYIWNIYGIFMEYIWNIY